MSKEKYITLESVSAKTEEWKRRIRPFYYDRKNIRFAPEKCALLVIDMQNYFARPEGSAFLPASAAVVPNISNLLDFYRKRGLVRLFTRHGHAGEDDLGLLGRFWGDYIKKGSWESEIIEALKPLPEEKVIDKTRYDAFYKTDLEEALKTAGCSQVLISGVMTHLCCETTARAAFVRDFEVFFAIDACASSCEEFHLASIMNLANGVAIPITAAEVAQ